MAMKNFKLIIEYDGSAYCGWQRQPNGPTIQAAIEDALTRMTRQRLTLVGSGRTDAGVHAAGQVANFKCDTRLTAHEFQNGLNALLADDIVIRDCEQVDTAFHARFAAIAKTYRYRILNRPLPAAIGRQYQWWIRTPLDTAAMAAAAGYLVGERDFRGFEGAGSPRAHTIRRVMRAELRSDNQGYILFEIEAQGFLRYMVRNIMGTLVAVGRHQLAPGSIADILEARDRSLAGQTAPARGLCLMKVTYAPEDRPSPGGRRDRP